MEITINVKGLDRLAEALVVLAGAMIDSTRQWDDEAQPVTSAEYVEQHVAAALAGKPLPEASNEEREAPALSVVPDPEPEATTAEVPWEEPAPEINLATVRAALAAYRTAKGAEAARDVLKKRGYAKLPEVPKELYAEIMAEIGG